MNSAAWVVLLLCFGIVAAASGPSGRGAPDQADLQGTPVDPRSGPDLYRTYCSPCHGAHGRGDGAAARFLDPAPRNFHDEEIRFVSTESGGPSDHDLFEIISAGLPGTAMQGFAGSMNEGERSAVIRVVRAFQREGALSAAEGDDLSSAEKEAWVRSRTDPGLTLRAPPEPANTIESAARGRMLFLKLCSACHARDGSGTIVPSTVGTASEVRARDLRRGVMKGGIEPARLFTRLRRGIPGTAMPSVPAASADDASLWDVVHYLGALMPTEAQRLADPVSFAIPVPRGRGPGSELGLQNSTWTHEESWIALSPFRASEAGIDGVLMRALHDGQHVAFELRWADSTWNRAGAEPATSPDGIAVRTTNQSKPPVLPLPGQPLPLDRALWLSGPMPLAEDPWFSSPGSPFINPDQVCRAPIGPERVGEATWRDGYWTARLVIRPERGGGLVVPGKLQVSFAAFDGASRRGPLPVSFSAWQELVLLP